MTTLSLLLKSTAWYATAVERALHDKGLTDLTRRQIFVIANIVAGEQRGNRIASNLGISRQAISQTIIELSRLGYLKTRKDPSSKRSRIVSLSAGSQNHRLCASVFAELDKELARSIGNDAFKALTRILAQDWGGAASPSTAAPRAAKSKVTGKRAGKSAVRTPKKKAARRRAAAATDK